MTPPPTPLFDRLRGQPEKPLPEWLRRQKERAKGQRFVAVKDLTARPQ